MKLRYSYIIALIPIIALIFIVYYFSSIVTYIVLAWILSMVGQPINRLFRKFSGKNMAAVLTLLSFSLVFALLFWLFVPPVVQQARNLAQIDYASLIQSLEEPIDDWNNWLVDKGLMEGEAVATTDSVQMQTTTTAEEGHGLHREWIRLDSIYPADTTGRYVNLLISVYPQRGDPVAESPAEETKNVPTSFFEEFRQNLYAFLNPARIQKLFGSIVGFFGNFVIAVMSVYFIAFFFLREQGLFINMISAFVPNAYEERVIHAVDESSRLLIRYFIGVVFQITVITLFVSIVLSLFGIKNALLIGFFAALMNVIPYIGPLIGAAFGVVITISSNLNLSFYSELLPLLLIVVVVFMIMQLLDNFLLQPTIFGKSVKAHPLEIFIVVLAGAQIGGIMGMVLAIPGYTVLRVIAKVFLSEFKIVQRITRGI